jgi:hypothetical protein
LDDQIELQFKESERIIRNKALITLREAKTEMKDIVLGQRDKRKISTGANRGSRYIGVSSNGSKW